MGLDVYKEIERFRRAEADNIKEAIQYENAVGIDPNTFIAKEILYQTAELKLIREELALIKQLILKAR